MKPDANRAIRWPRGFDEHELEQLRRLARLPFRNRLVLVEEMEVVAERIADAVGRQKKSDC